MAIKVTAVIPVINEAGAIGPTISGLPPNVVNEIIVVDGGSTDSTVAEASAAGAHVIQEQRRGYGRACLAGAEQARERGGDVVLFLDGDGADAVEKAEQIILPLLRDEADFVLASRTLGRREPGSMGLHQILAGRVIGTALLLLAGFRYTDMCAYRAIRLDLLAMLGMQEMGFGWNLEMQLRAGAAGLRIREIAVPYRRRIAGRSKVSGDWRGTLKAGTHILLTLVRVSVDLRRRARA